MLLHDHHDAVLGERQLLRHVVLRAHAHAEAGRTRSSRAAGLVAAISSLAAAMVCRKLNPTRDPPPGMPHLSPDQDFWSMLLL